jgi:hypothetical protein
LRLPPRPALKAVGLATAGGKVVVEVLGWVAVVVVEVAEELDGAVVVVVVVEVVEEEEVLVAGVDWTEDVLLLVVVDVEVDAVVVDVEVDVDVLVDVDVGEVCVVDGLVMVGTDDLPHNPTKRLMTRASSYNNS